MVVRGFEGENSEEALNDGTHGKGIDNKCVREENRTGRGLGDIDSKHQQGLGHREGKQGRCRKRNSYLLNMVKRETP